MRAPPYPKSSALPLIRNRLLAWPTACGRCGSRALRAYDDDQSITCLQCGWTFYVRPDDVVLVPPDALREAHISNGRARWHDRSPAEIRAHIESMTAARNAARRVVRAPTNTAVRQTRALKRMEKLGWSFRDLAARLHDSKANVATALTRRIIYTKKLDRLARIESALG